MSHFQLLSINYVFRGFFNSFLKFTEKYTNIEYLVKKVDVSFNMAGLKRPIVKVSYQRLRGE